MSEKSSDIQCTPPELAELTDTAIVIPEKSRQLYEESYNRLVKFCEEQQAVNFSENVLLAYFYKLSKQYKSSTLWSNFSMIKAVLNIKHNVYLNTYTKLTAFLKQNGKGYTAKKSKVLTKQQFDEFLQRAPDNAYLAIKVVLIFGIMGACRCDELLNLTVNDITDLDKLILVKIPSSRTTKPRSFTIMGDFYINLYRKYAALRPKDINTARFFIKYNNNKCHRVVMGRHKIARTAKDVASFLHLPNSSEYTGHCLRKTSAKILVDMGGDITPLEQLDGDGNQLSQGDSGNLHTEIDINSEVSDCEGQGDGDYLITKFDIKPEVVDCEAQGDCDYLHKEIDITSGGANCETQSGGNHLHKSPKIWVKSEVIDHEVQSDGNPLRECAEIRVKTEVSDHEDELFSHVAASIQTTDGLSTAATRERNYLDKIRKLEDEVSCLKTRMKEMEERSKTPGTDISLEQFCALSFIFCNEDLARFINSQLNKESSGKVGN